jgi:hypothetical protein
MRDAEGHAMNLNIADPSLSHQRREVFWGRESLH